MGSPEENLEIARQAVAAYQRGDLEAVLARLHDDSEVYMPNSLPNAGTFRGREGFLEWLGNWLEAWEEFTVEVKRMEPIGERHVVVDMQQNGTGKGSGVPVKMNIAYMWEIRDGNFFAQHLYPTWDEAVGVARDRENNPSA